MRIAPKIVSAALALALVLTGCSSEPEPEPTQTPTAAQTPTQTPEPEPEPVYEIAPLTGVAYLEGENPYLALPAVSAKIDNSTAGRPQLALNDADIVYVTRVEVGLTRLLPVWHSIMPESIGPVRSVRPVDAAVAHPYGGVFVYSGGQAPFKNAAKATGLVMSDEDTEMRNDTYFRDSNRKAPWNLNFRAQKLQELHKDASPAPAAHFLFDAIPSAVKDGAPVKGLEVKYPQMRSTWTLGSSTFPWATESQSAWLRTQDNREHVQAGGDRVVARNVIVMEVTHDNSFVDPTYGAIPKAKLENNEGVVHVFSDGHYIKGKWTKGASSAGIKLLTESGEELKLAIGNTWVEMMDVPRSTLTIEQPEG